MDRPLDLDALDDEAPFEIDDQAAHLFKHADLGIEDIYERLAVRPAHLSRQTPRLPG